MANTLIQIKRSSSTAIPGTLNIAEPAYSFVSNTLFLGTGTGVIPIGGKYYVDIANTGLATALGAFAAANSALSGSGAAGAAFDKANSANVLAYTTSIITSAAYDQANTATATAVGAFATANNALPKAGGTITGDLVIQGNATISGAVTYANTQTLLIGDNIFVVNADLPSTVAPSENAGFEVNRGSSTNTSIIWNEGIDAWTFTNNGTNYVKIASNTDVELASTIASGAFNTANSATTIAVGAFGAANNGIAIGSAAFDKANAASTIGSAAFGKANSGSTIASAAFNAANSATSIAVGAFTRANTALTAAANASYINTGTLAVAYGGTGVNSLTTNGVLYGNATGPVQVTGAGTEGQVLQATAAGVPQFGMLDGGVF